MIAIVAAFLPTIDPVTLILEMIPLILLYELSIVLAAVLGQARRAARRASPPAPSPASLRAACFSISRASAAAWCRPPI